MWQNYASCNYEWDRLLLHSGRLCNRICKDKAFYHCEWITVSYHFEQVLATFVRSSHVFLFVCIKLPRGYAQKGRRMRLKIKTMRRRRRKWCIYAVHPLLSSLTGRNKPCWLSAWLDHILLTRASAFSEPLFCSSFCSYSVFKTRTTALFLSPGTQTRTPWPPKMFIDMNSIGMMEVLVHFSNKRVLFWGLG